VDLWTAQRSAAHNPTGSTKAKIRLHMNLIYVPTTHLKLKRSSFIFH
jgi:hypothetical protein